MSNNVKVINQKIKTKVEIEIEADIQTNDIFNWLMACNDADTLRYLGKAALNRCRAIENPDDDDFRSR